MTQLQPSSDPKPYTDDSIVYALLYDKFGITFIPERDSTSSILTSVFQKLSLRLAVCSIINADALIVLPFCCITILK